jgi:hypothetical protein
MEIIALNLVILVYENIHERMRLQENFHETGFVTN